MALYAYRCETDGPVEVRRPIGTAPAILACPSCGGRAARMFTAPMLGPGDRVRTALIDRTTATAHEPAVVSAPPPRPGRRRAPAPHPATRLLPRP